MSAKTQSPPAGQGSAAESRKMDQARSGDPTFYPATDTFTRDGFFLVGTVKARVRRHFAGTDGKPGRFNHTLSIQTDHGLERPERWCDSPSPSDVPDRGDRIILPVAVSFFRTKGGTGCRLTWGDNTKGEEY
jgi:hypothetical protein